MTHSMGNRVFPYRVTDIYMNLRKYCIYYSKYWIYEYYDVARLLPPAFRLVTNIPSTMSFQKVIRNLK
jgi:hypothetical protein